MAESAAGSLIVAGEAVYPGNLCGSRVSAIEIRNTLRCKRAPVRCVAAPYLPTDGRRLSCEPRIPAHFLVAQSLLLYSRSREILVGDKRRSVFHQQWIARVPACK